MERVLGRETNQILNGDFSEKCSAQDFPEAWLPIGGNQATSWKYKQESQTEHVLEISNSTITRAGIVQTVESSLAVGKDEHWLIKVVFKSQQPESKGYLRLYPVNLKGNVMLPWEFSFHPRLEQEKQTQFKQTVGLASNIKFLRLEVGVLGSGKLSICKLLACPLPLKRWKKKSKNEHKAPPLEYIQSIGEILKPIRLATPIPLHVPVNVQAKVHADIRNLTPLRDRIQIYGSGQAPLATSSCGRAQVEIFGHGFQESLEDVTASLTMSSTTTRDVAALGRFSFAIYNFGNLSASVQIEFSPDGLHWAAEGAPREAAPETLIILSSETFLRYTRISYWANGLTHLRVWVQAQN
ncbi:DUF6385 domain-containing protein [Desulfosporosinus sp. PR]|uniref:DUF6385 domain-containing protein n=1 Tax=Candidatus Desulfosporosinus nitrosoreducens TaxID=3401928 RepID=UPI0027F42FE7|nr:DUF6385 domain-containing protein [Desulfosporosinus sp. PR]MDQ7092686.1 DUF6385 domain-containing protein [Desulfosporosinus sp. PR]